MKRFRRAGFTLIEMLVVIAILGVVAGASVPAIRSARAVDPLEKGTDAIGNLLARSRQSAVERAAGIRVSIDPASRRYTVRMLTTDAPNDSVVADSLILPDGVTLDDASGWLAVTFAPSGEARGDAFTLRWQGRAATITVNQWTGDAHVAGH